MTPVRMNRSLWITLGLIVLGAVLGYYGNVLANKENNALLVQLLKDQINCVDSKINSLDGMKPGKYQADIYNQLQAQKSRLETQLQYYSNKFGIS